VTPGSRAMHVLGTAGHVDHGKSTLVHRLTGIDPDRLAEEKVRGLTIDLGFAWLALPSGREVGIVDVPGHERFVHTMLAGVGPVDAAIFVVDAAEGWKPQSEEHLAILDLLGTRGGVVVLTKRDLVAEAELDRVAHEVKGRLAGTALDAAEVVAVSAVTGEGMEELVAALERLLERTPPAPDRGRPRLWVDRSFTIRGAGTVVTGTLAGGALREGEEVEVLPGGRRARIRAIETHRRRRHRAEPGSRVALNLAGIERDEVGRGDAVVTPGAWRATDLLDVWMRPVRGLGEPVAPRGSYTVHVGSAEVPARLAFLDAASLAPGGEAYARLVLARPVAVDAFDRFVLRDTGRRATVAGGVVLDPHPAERRLRGPDRARRGAELRARRAAGQEGLAARVVEERGVVAAADLRWMAGVEAPPGPLRGYAASEAWLAGMAEALTATLERFHRARPLERGMPREDARAALGERDPRLAADPRLFAALLEALADRVVAEGPLLRLASHRVTLSPEERAARERILARLEEAGFAPPSLEALAREHGRALVAVLLEGGDLVRVAPDIAFTRARYEEARRRIAEAARREGPLTASQIRTLLGTSRKYAIPLLEHLDAVGFTRRSGDLRTVPSA
jgi:selenocysteine-specific elongation factor